MILIDNIKKQFNVHIDEKYASMGKIKELNDIPINIIHNIIDEYQDQLKDSFDKFEADIKNKIKHYKDRHYKDEEITVTIKYNLRSLNKYDSSSAVSLEMRGSIATKHSKLYSEINIDKSIYLTSHEYTKEKNEKGEDFINRLKASETIDKL